jgi:hypothetical protein
MMWHKQPENSRTDFAITADNVTNTTFYVKTGAALKSAQKTTSQKSHNWIPSSFGETQSLYLNLVLIGLNQLLFMLVHQAIRHFKALVRLTAEQTCSPTRYKTMYLG